MSISTNLQEYQWPNEFWPEFIDSYWEQHPTSFQCPALKPFISLEELFIAITNMPSFGPSDRLWIARCNPPKHRSDFTMAPLKVMGPQKSDLDLDGYFNRLARHTFGINVHALNKGIGGLSARVQGFLKNLSHVSGKPISQSWDLDAFIGTYRATPFGIHKDPASVFVFSLMGERTYYTWTSDYFKEGDGALHTPDLTKIKPHLKNAQMFTLSPGEIFYWPSNRWHIVMSDGTPSVVAQISTYFKPEDLDHWHRKSD